MDISRKAKRAAGDAENKARDVKDNAQQKLDDIMPGNDNGSHPRNRRRNRR